MTLNPVTWFQKEVPIVEQDVLNFIHKVENGVAIAIKDAEGALSWIASQVPAIASDLQMVEGFVLANPALAVNPTVLASITAANLAVQGLNAFAGSVGKSGGTLTVSAAAQAITAGYQAVKQATIASANSASTAVGATNTASPK